MARQNMNTVVAKPDDDSPWYAAMIISVFCRRYRSWHSRYYLAWHLERIHSNNVGSRGQIPFKEVEWWFRELQIAPGKHYSLTGAKSWI